MEHYINYPSFLFQFRRLLYAFVFALLLLFFLPVTGQAQTITNYTFATSSGTFTALASPTNPALSGGNVDDGYFNAIPISFDFWYMGTRYTTVSASTNGWLTLGANITDAAYTNNISTGGAPRPVIAPLWDDLDVQVATNVSYKVTGSAPTRVFTIQYLNAQWQYNATGNTISFQVNLYEGSGKIEFIYRPESGTLATPTASIGISAAATGSGNFLSVNNAGTSVSSTTEASVTSKPVSGKTYAFTPPVPTAPGSLTFSSVSTSSMTLNWSDLSSNERGFAIYSSTDGVNYSFVTQTAAGATSSVQSGLVDGTTYYWKIYAVSEGGMSTALSGSQATTAIVVGWYNSSWLYRKLITIDYTKVSAGPHTNFPVLISRADTDLQTYAQTDGDDIFFTSSDGTTKLDHQVESYTSGTGTLVAWVEIPSLSSIANTNIYMYYGNASAANQENVTGTWNSNYKGVWHLNGAFADATSNANNGTNTGTTAATGMISGGRGFVRSDGADYITITGLMGSPANATLSAWGTLTSRDATGAHIINIGDYLSINVDDVTDGYLGSYYDAGWGLTRSSPKLNPAGSGWHYFVFTFDDASNAQVLYMDGVQVGSGTFANSIGYSSLGANTFIGMHANGNANYDFDGTIDEVRVSNAIRSAGWVLTEYNNQNSPSTFVNVASSEPLVKTWDGGAGTNNWGDANNWNPNGLPSYHFVSLTGANTININVAAAAGNITLNNAGLTLTIQSTRSLTVAENFLLTAGTLNTEASFPTVSGTVTLSSGTVDYTAASGTQTVAAQTYYNLNFSGGGTKTMPASAFIVSGNFTMSGTSSATAGGALTVNGAFTIGSGCTFGAGSYTLGLAGNFVNNGTFTASTGTVILNGISSQSITGVTTFNNLTLSNSNGATLNNATTVQGVLTLTSGTLAAGGNLTVNLNTGAIAGTGTGAITGNINLSKTVNSNKYHYISSPLSGRTAADWNDDVTISQGPQYLNLYQYNETYTDTTNTVGWEGVTGLSTSLESMKGYALYFRNATTIDVTGTYTHSDAYSKAGLTNTVSSNNGTGKPESDGWHLIGNPYPSTLDWEAASGWTKTNLDDAIYFWDPVNNRYASYISGAGTNGGTQYIPSMQGFWVKTNVPGGTGALSMNNSVRVTSTNPAVWRTAATNDMLTLKASSGAYSDETIIRFMDDAQETFDAHADAYKMSNSDNTPSLYTVMGGKKFSINSLGMDSENITIPVKLDAGFTGSYTLTAKQSGGFQNMEAVILEDRLLGVSQDLLSNPSYTCNVTKGDNSGRFFIIFKRAIVNSTITSGNAPSLSVKGIGQNVQLKFSNTISRNATIMVSNLLGQEMFFVKDADISNGEFWISLPTIQTGMYMVKIWSPDFLKSEKVFLNQ